MVHVFSFLAHLAESCDALYLMRLMFVGWPQKTLLVCQVRSLKYQVAEKRQINMGRHGGHKLGDVVRKESVGL